MPLDFESALTGLDNERGNFIFIMAKAEVCSLARGKIKGVILVRTPTKYMIKKYGTWSAAFDVNLKRALNAKKR